MLCETSKNNDFRSFLVSGKKLSSLRNLLKRIDRHPTYISGYVMTLSREENCSGVKRTYRLWEIFNFVCELSMFLTTSSRHDFPCIRITLKAGLSVVAAPHFFFGIPLLPSVSTLPLDPPPLESDLSSNSFPGCRSSFFVGGASSANSNPTSGHLKVKIRIQPLDT